MAQMVRKDKVRRADKILVDICSRAARGCKFNCAVSHTVRTTRAGWLAQFCPYTEIYDAHHPFIPQYSWLLSEIESSPREEVQTTIKQTSRKILRHGDDKELL